MQQRWPASMQTTHELDIVRVGDDAVIATVQTVKRGSAFLAGRRRSSSATPLSKG